MPVAIAYILGFIAALGGTIAAFIVIVPEKKRERLSKPLRKLHDFFNFKSLWIEKILKFLYILETLACIAIGFFMLFSVQHTFFETRYMGLTGILLMVLGPIAARIIFEFLMLAVLMVRNTIEINSKLAPQEGSPADKKAKEEAAEAEEQARRNSGYTPPANYPQPPYYAPGQYYPPQYPQQPVQNPYTQPEQNPYAQTEQIPNIPPEQPPYTQPEQTSYSQPEQTSYSQPEQNPNTQPEQNPNTQPEQPQAPAQNDQQQ